MISRVVFGQDAMLLDRRPGCGPHEYFQLDDASLPWNMSPDAVVRLLYADVPAEPALQEWRQDVTKLLRMAQQRETRHGRILGNGHTRAGLRG